jgi:hypothetical protein
MKKLFILFLLTVGINAAQAQPSIENTGSGVNQTTVSDDDNDADQNAAAAGKAEANRAAMANAISMDYMTMNVQDNAVVFDNMPNLNSITVHITTANGDEVITKKITAKNNKVSISRLRKGVHFITLTTDNSDSRRSFTLNRD